MEYKIYNVLDPVFTNYLCRGKLCDALWDLSRSKERIREETLVSEDSLESIQQPNELGTPYVTVYRVLYCSESTATKHHGIDNPLKIVAQQSTWSERKLIMSAAKKTVWFTDKTKALDAAKDWNCDDYILLFESLVNVSTIPKVNFPIYDFLWTGPDGKRSIRLNLHPERDGRNSNGMICFLDRSCKDIPAGRIIISSVKEFSTYGFIKAEPYKETNVLDSSCSYQFGCYLRDQIRNQRLTPYTFLSIVDSPVRGRYVVRKEDYLDIYTHSRKTIYHVYDKFGNGDHITFMSDMRSHLASDIEAYISREVDAETLAAECIFNKYGGVDAIRKRCQESESVWYRSVNSSNNLSAEIMNIQIPSITQVMNDAYNNDLIDMYALRSSGVEFISFIDGNLNRFIYFSGEEIEEIFKIVKEFNEKADRRMNMLSKKHKLPIIKM